MSTQVSDEIIERPDLECEGRCDDPDIYQLEHRESPWGDYLAYFRCDNCDTYFTISQTTEIEVLEDNEIPQRFI